MRSDFSSNNNSSTSMYELLQTEKLYCTYKSLCSVTVVEEPRAFALALIFKNASTFFVG